MSAGLAVVTSLFGCRGETGAADAPPVSVWFPSLVAPYGELAAENRSRLLSACGISSSEMIWMEFADLDADAKNEAVVTIQLPPEAAGAKGQTSRYVTCVFAGAQSDIANQNFKAEGLWFALETRVVLGHLFGDSEQRRQFVVERSTEGNTLRIHEVLAANDGGESSSRFMQPRFSRTYTMRVADIPKGKPLPLKLDDVRR